MKGNIVLCIHVLENKKFNVFVIVLFPLWFQHKISKIAMQSMS